MIPNSRPLVEHPNLLPGATYPFGCECGEKAFDERVVDLSAKGWVFVTYASGARHVWCPYCSRGQPSPHRTLYRQETGRWWERATHTEGGYA